ncbi:MAG: DoxX family membrane protein [Candidatus Marinimicrobia bacterium]|nr:DoxX family membrane protein [Candidatus Neomarinimicrobiota bacterium]
MTHKKQIIFIFSLAIVLGFIRFSILDDPEFTLIKKERILETINSFSVPEDMISPMAINLEFAQHLFNENMAVFVDARDSEDYNSGHIENAVNIPFDYYEDYEDAINEMDDTFTHVIYCSGEDCSLSMDLADYFFNELAFEKVLIFEGGWPQWRDAELPSSLNSSAIVKTVPKETEFDIDKIISWTIVLSAIFIAIHLLSIKGIISLPLTGLNVKDISVLPRIILGLVFIFASYHKILDPVSFSENIHNFHLTPATVENIAGLVLPWLELILGVFLIFGVFLEGSTSLTIGLYIFFIIILSQAVIRGIDVHCGCFKTESDAGVTDLKMELIKRIGEDILLLGMAFIYRMKNKITLSNKDHE